MKPSLVLISNKYRGNDFLTAEEIFFRNIAAIPMVMIKISYYKYLIHETKTFQEVY